MNIPDHLRQWAKEHPRAARTLWGHIQDCPHGGMNVYVPMDLGVEPDTDWNTPIPRDVFMEHFARGFADLEMTPAHVSALTAIAIQLSFYNLDAMIKLIADALEDHGAPE